MAKAKTAPKARRQRRGVTRADFVGTKMANLLFQIAQSGYVDRAERDLADKLRKQWDSVYPMRLNNPTVLIELEAKFFPKPEEDTMEVYGSATIGDYQRQGYGKTT